MNDARTVTINGKRYSADQFSDGAQGHIRSLRACDVEIARLEVLVAITKTARNSYARALSEELGDSPGSDVRS